MNKKETKKAAANLTAELSLKTVQELKPMAANYQVPLRNLNKSDLIAAIVEERVGLAGQAEGLERYRRKLLATRETEPTSLYLTYRDQFNAPDVFNRYLNQVKMPGVQGEHGNYVRAMLAIAVTNAFTLYCTLHGHMRLRKFVRNLGNELL